MGIPSLTHSLYAMVPHRRCAALVIDDRNPCRTTAMQKQNGGTKKLLSKQNICSLHFMIGLKITTCVWKAASQKICLRHIRRYLAWLHWDGRSSLDPLSLWPDTCFRVRRRKTPPPPIVTRFLKDKRFSWKPSSKARYQSRKIFGLLEPELNS